MAMAVTKITQEKLKEFVLEEVGNDAGLKEIFSRFFKEAGQEADKLKKVKQKEFSDELTEQSDKIQAIYKKAPMEPLKIGKNELNDLIKEEVVRQENKLLLKKRISEVKSELQQLDEFVNAPAMQSAVPAVKEEKSESIFDAKPGETVLFNFQDVTIKMQRQLDDLFKITDAMESKKLKEGDYIKIQGNDILQKGRKFKFVILRKAIDYESNQLLSWKVIKNR